MFRWLLMLLAVALVALLMGSASAGTVPGTARMTMWVAMALAMMGIFAHGNRAG